MLGCGQAVMDGDMNKELIVVMGMDKVMTDLLEQVG
jgi:hypothetical protein